MRNAQILYTSFHLNYNIHSKNRQILTLFSCSLSSIAFASFFPLLPSSSLLFNINANFVHRNMQRNQPNETKRAFVLHQISYIFSFDFVTATLHEPNEVVAATTTATATKPCTRVSHSFDPMA